MAVETIDGMLHLSELTVAITAGYIGVDRVNGERNSFLERLNQVYDEIQDALISIGVLSGQNDNQDHIQKRLSSLEQFIDLSPILTLISIVNSKDYKNKHHSGRVLCSRFKNFPFLNYFKSGTDKTVVSYLFIISLAIFLWITFNHIIPCPILENTTSVLILYLILCAILLCTIVPAACTRRLLNIKQRADALLDTFNASVQKLVTAKIDAAEHLSIRMVSSNQPDAPNDPQ